MKNSFLKFNSKRKLKKVNADLAMQNIELMKKIDELEFILDDMIATNEIKIRLKEL